MVAGKAGSLMVAEPLMSVRTARTSQLRGVSAVARSWTECRTVTAPAATIVDTYAFEVGDSCAKRVLLMKVNGHGGRPRLVLPVAA